MNIEIILEEIGLSSKETKIYLTLHQIGNQPMSVISKKSGINRTTCYKIVEDLTKKGLVTSYKKKNSTYICPENPKALIKYIQLQKNRLEKQEEIITDSIKYLNSLQHKSIKKPTVKFYEGKDALKQAYENTLNSSEPIRAYANIKEMHECLPNFFPDYYKRRTEAGIFIYTICPNNQICKKRQQKDKTENRIIKFLDKTKYNFGPEMNVYENKVLLVSWQEKMAILISSEEIANLYKKTFDALWDTL